MSRDKNKNVKPLRPLDPKLERRRRVVEAVATTGLVIVAVGLMVPILNLSSGGHLEIFKWVFAAGALIYTIARCVNVNDPRDSKRLRRLRRMEAWAGMAFCFGAFFWFYNESKALPYSGPLFIIRDTIAFTLAGALLQVIASWMIALRDAKERTIDHAD